MSRSLVRMGFVAAAAILAVVAIEGIAQHAAPAGGSSGVWPSGAWAGEYTLEAKPRKRRHARRRRPEGSTAEEIARYFQLYGGFIDPSINKQTQAGPFDSGFFFDSGIGPNGGDSPYMN